MCILDCENLSRIVNLPSNNLILVILLEDIKDEMKLNANITKLLSEAKTNFSDDEHEVKAFIFIIFIDDRVFCVSHKNFIVLTCGLELAQLVIAST